MIQVGECPVCLGNNFSHFLTCEDFTVSHETFQLLKCAGCGLVFTCPRPEPKSLDRYYESTAYISHANKSLTLLDRVYKVSRWFTLRWKYNLIRNHLVAESTPTVLDYGCGTGAFLQECAKHEMKTAGVEPSAVARQQASENTKAKIASSLDQITEKYDTITLWHVLEHVGELNETLSNLCHHLKQNGTMFIAVPNHQSLDAQTYGQYWAGYDVPRHLWHFTAKTMCLLLERHGLKLITTLPMKLDAYYVSLLSEKYKAGNHKISGISRAVVRAWKSNIAATKTREFSSLIFIVQK